MCGGDVEERENLGLALRRKKHRTLVCVHDPSENLLGGFPVPISFQRLLEACLFLDLPHTSTHVPDHLQYIDVYMEDLLCDNQGYAAQQQRVSDMIIRSLKDILPSVLGEIKESASLKKAYP